MNQYTLQSLSAQLDLLTHQFRVSVIKYSRRVYRQKVGAGTRTNWKCCDFIIFTDKRETFNSPCIAMYR